MILYLYDRMSGFLTVGNITLNGGAMNNLTSVRILQLRRLLDFYQYCPGGLGSIGRQFMLCSPTYPCVTVGGWMNEGNRAYGLLTVGNYNTLNSVTISDGNGNGNANRPITLENTTGDIQWYYLANGVGSIDNNVELYGINLNNGAPNYNPSSWSYSGNISSARVYSLPYPY